MKYIIALIATLTGARARRAELRYLTLRLVAADRAQDTRRT